MPHETNPHIVQLQSITLACQDALLADDPDEILDLLATRQSLIDKLDPLSLTPNELVILSEITQKTISLESQLSLILRTDRQELRRDQKALKSVKNFNQNVPPTNYEQVS